MVKQQLRLDSLEAFTRSLGITEPVTTTPHPFQAAPRIPSAFLSAAVGLVGVGRVLPLQARRDVAALCNVPLDLAHVVLNRIHRLDAWPRVWMEEGDRQAGLAARHERAGNLSAAWEAWCTALACQRMATFADGVLLPVPSPDERWRIYNRLRHSHGHIARLEGRPVHELKIPGPVEKIPAIFHLPGEGVRRAPTLVLVHGLSGYKEFKDHQALALRDAGFATLALDMPAHGERFFGSRLRPDSETDCMAALDWLSTQPEVDPERLGLLGGSMGGYWVLRTAAADDRVRACVALAAPYAMGRSGSVRQVPRNRKRPRKQGVPFLLLEFARVMGSTDPEVLENLAQQFTLEGVAASIQCSLFLGYGTRDAIVPFSECWRLAREVQAEDLTIHPYVGAGHEVAGPGPEHLPPILGWLGERLL
ncbi:MAG: alpha/beta hydrolase family protein [Anaerolineae bacterium]